MKTISPNEFFGSFIQLSEKFTLAELRMLYLLIIQPATIDLTQQEFATKIKTHRRTINLGLKKLREFGLVIDFEENKLEIKDESMKIIPLEVLDEARVFIISRIIDFYSIGAKSIIVQEDFYSIILGNNRYPKKLRQNREFINATIKSTFPDFKFHFLLNASDYGSEKEYNVVNYINNEIVKRMNLSNNSIPEEMFLNDVWENYNVSKKEAYRILESNFRHISFRNNDIIIMKNLWNTYFRKHD